MRKAILATAFATFLTGCVHTPQVEKVEGTWDGNGVLYALPRTAIDATFEVSKVDFKAPECKTSNDERKTIAEQLDLSLKQLILALCKSFLVIVVRSTFLRLL